MILSQFQEVGRSLFAQGLVSLQSGNLSIRLGDSLFITHRGTMLGSIEEGDLVQTGITKNGRATPMASSELPVHRSIYRHTSALSVVHAHPPYAVALSFMEEEIVPRDIEGKLLFPRVPVLGKEVAKANELCQEITEVLKQHKVVLLRGHGSFAAGQLLEEACYYTTALEYSCRLLYLLRGLGLFTNQNS
jgi:L-fuculose-phosphate aldolase